MSNKQFKSALRKMRNGIKIYRKDSPVGRALFTVEHENGKFRGVIRTLEDPSCDVIEIWETSSLDWLRRIAVGYYPAIAKAIGPARQFIGV